MTAATIPANTTYGQLESAFQDYCASVAKNEYAQCLDSPCFVYLTQTLEKIANPIENWQDIINKFKEPKSYVPLLKEHGLYEQYSAFVLEAALGTTREATEILECALLSDEQNAMVYVTVEARLKRAQGATGLDGNILLEKVGYNPAEYQAAIENIVAGFSEHHEELHSAEDTQLYRRKAKEILTAIYDTRTVTNEQLDNVRTSLRQGHYSITTHNAFLTLNALQENIENGTPVVRNRRLPHWIHGLDA